MKGKSIDFRQTVQRLRNSFESKEKDVIRWISATNNLAEALKKECTYVEAVELNVCCRAAG